MSTTTPFLGLVLYDSTTDQVVTFATFRAVWGGTATSSNFYKIDTAMAALDARVDILEGLKPPVRIPANFISSNFYQATGITDVVAYTTGMTILLSVDTTSSGTVTLDINSLGTKSVMKVDSTGTPINLTGSDLVKNRQYLFMYDGTRWLWVSANSADQIQIVGTAGNVVTVGATNNLVGTVSQTALIVDNTHAASSKATPVDADEIPLADSAASFGLKKLTWANLKATLKTYFDTLYLAITNKASAAEVSTGTDDVKYVTSSGIRNSVIGNSPDGQGINYQITTSVASNNLTIALKGMDGNDASSTNPIIVRVGNTKITLTAALSVSVNAAAGDIFAWDGRKIQANDAQLFVYFINNNGTAQLGVSPCPYLTTVATNYYDGSQTGAAGFNNMVMSGTRNATNTCRVIGRVNVNQLDNNNWQNPTTANVVNNPIYETDWLTWTPQHSRSTTGYTNAPSVQLAIYKIQYNITYFRETHTQNATPGGSGNQTFTFPITSVGNFFAYGTNVNTTNVMTGLINSSTGLVTIAKYDGTAEVTASNSYGLQGFHQC